MNRPCRRAEGGGGTVGTASGARHVCWALLAGGQSAAVDDGEPSGTAGRPMLDVLRHQDLEGVLATVVRYFGGVKLGAGGWCGPIPTRWRRRC
ncbi:YigZ family protein [Thauera humireducens]|uniref:YigZ family protein n=1 Tax=Thauera humireducens TaxID=1134435 RepID=UPI003120387A